MKVGFPGGSRPIPIDRGATRVFNSFDLVIGGGAGLTVQFTYTVPTARKASIGLLAMAASRVTVAAPDAEALVSARISTNVVARCSCTHENTIAAHREVSLAGGVDLFSGETFDMTSTNGDVGGSVRLQGSFAATEFDA